MTEQMTPIGSKETFTFTCHRGIRCFNHCCRDLNQYLTPYDILRMKNRLAISSGDFLDHYTVQHIGPQSGLPIVTFRMESAHGLTCPFVTPQGCAVYEDRPASCRTYPLARIVSRSRETGKLSVQYMLIREDHCFGFEEPGRQTVEEWIRSQGLAEYNDMNDRVLDVIRLKNRNRPGPLDAATQNLLRLALYDIDAFRAYAVEQNLSVPPQTVSDLESMDDTALLRFSLQWVQQVFV